MSVLLNSWTRTASPTAGADGGQPAPAATARSPKVCPPAGVPYIASIPTAYLCSITRRRSFKVGVRSSGSAVHSAGRIVKGVIASLLDTCSFAPASPPRISSITAGFNDSSAVEVSAMPWERAQCGATSWSRTISAPTNLPRNAAKSGVVECVRIALCSESALPQEVVPADYPVVGRLTLDEHNAPYEGNLVSDGEELLQEAFIFHEDDRRLTVVGEVLDLLGRQRVVHRDRSPTGVVDCAP